MGFGIRFVQPLTTELRLAPASKEPQPTLQNGRLATKSISDPHPTLYRSACTMFSNFKKELIIVSLLLATLALIFSNKFVERSYEVTALNIRGLGCSDDGIAGGQSEAWGENTGDVIKFRYRVAGEAFQKNYSLISIYPEDGFQSDLSWVDKFQIKIRTNRPGGEQVRFYVRDFDPGISEEVDRPRIKYNETLLSLSNELETITVRRDEFHVPTWWKQEFAVKGKAARLSFDNVESFEFNTNNAGEGEIEIASIRCLGNWINPATLNQSLLWMWMGGMLIGIIFRMLNLKKKLDDKTVRESHLVAHNNLLISESATYHELARRDPLTGLFNRYGLETELEELSSKYYFDYTMLLFDLDKFKEINDNRGHSYGDRVLFDVATIVRLMLGERDIVARWGGDEFLVMLNNRTAKQASDFAEEIRQSVSASDLVYSCSFGICKAEIDSDFESTFSKADSALYDSKNSGRNKVSSYREKGGRRASDHDTSAVVPEITLRLNEMPSGEFTIYE